MEFDFCRITHSKQEYPLALPKLLPAQTGFTKTSVEPDLSISTNAVRCLSSSTVRSIFKDSSGLFTNSKNQPLLKYGYLGALPSVADEEDIFLSGNSFLLGRPNSVNFYYHWLLDEIPRIHYLEQSGYPIESIDHWLVRSSEHAYHVAYLKQAGIDLKKVFVIPDNTFVHYENLIYIESGNGLGLRMNKEVPNYLNSLFPIEEKEIKDRKSIYVSRPTSTRRHVTNEKDLLPIAKEAGFEILEMEGLTVKQQVEVFRKADNVVSPHGAALSNIVFCQPGTRVLELFGRHVFPFYYGLSAVCGHDYYAILEEADDLKYLVNLDAALAKQSDKGKTDSLNISVNPEAFGQYIELTCNSRAITDSAA